jgi:hypothetical protein
MAFTRLGIAIAAMSPMTAHTINSSTIENPRDDEWRWIFMALKHSKPHASIERVVAI